MARDAYHVINRYAARMKASHLGNVFSERYLSMVTNFATYYGDWAGYQEATKQVLNNSGILPNNYPIYLSFSRRIYSLTKDYNGPTLWALILNEIERFVNYHLDGEILRNIVRDVFGITPTVAPPGGGS